MTRLTDRAIKAFNEPGTFLDERGLYLRVEKGVRGINKTWVYRFQMDGHRTIMGLGCYPTVGLSDAREEAHLARRKVHAGINPIEERRALKTAVRVAAAKSVTFATAARALIDSKQAEWTNLKHAQQWRNTLATYADPVLGDIPVADIDTPLVREVLAPIWITKTETAKRVRMRIENVLDYARAMGWREGENPARWRDHFDRLLAHPNKIQKVTHHAALPYERTAEFMVALRDREGVSARALEFLILTASRVGPVINSKWNEIDLNARVWTCPAANMKRDNDHRVPISDDAVTVMRGMLEMPETEFVFANVGTGKGLSNMAMPTVIRRMQKTEDWPHFTVHGFRSTFRTWAQEKTLHQREVAEAALHHVLGDKVEKAYARGDVLAKRRRLMEDWAKFCSTPYVETEGDNVVPLHGEGQSRPYSPGGVRQ